MILTKRLIEFLNKPFSKDSDSFLALRISSPSGLRWSVENDFLTIFTNNENSVFDLRYYTLGELSAAISQVPSVSVGFLSPDSHLSALVLMDGSADQGESNGDHLYGYGSLMWSYMEAIAAELHEAKIQISNMIDQMSLLSADGGWLDEWGGYFGVPRLPGESDEIYGPRVIVEITLPRGNNIAIEMAIRSATGGFSSVVTDAPISIVTTSVLRDGFSTFSGHKSRAPVQKSFYGQFDVNARFDLLSPESVSDLMVRIRSAIEKFRDAGTRLRQVQLSGFMSDEAGPYSDAVVFGANELLLDKITPAFPHDGSVMRGSVIAFRYDEGARTGVFSRKGWIDGGGEFFGGAPDTLSASLLTVSQDQYAAPFLFNALFARQGSMARSGLRHTGVDHGLLLISKRYARNGVHKRGYLVSQKRNGSLFRGARRDGGLNYDYQSRSYGAAAYSGAALVANITYAGVYEISEAM